MFEPPMNEVDNYQICVNILDCSTHEQSSLGSFPGLAWSSEDAHRLYNLRNLDDKKFGPLERIERIVIDEASCRLEHGDSVTLRAAGCSITLERKNLKSTQ